ncbi:hypothetical protein HUU05_27400 [candidate division KSB1 bacterium]|nr:hypothetical protein [candidate division KSB1 bacterium]
MNKIWAVCYYTFRESLARKTFIGFFIITSIVLAILLLAINIDAVDGALAGVSVFGKEARGIDMELSKLVIGIEVGLATALFTAGLFFSIFATASLVPNMLDKGNIDWLLAKPISREALLVGRYLGGLMVVAFNVFYLIAGAWLILSMKTGVWHFPFLLSGVLIIAIFAVIYAFMVFLGVSVQNSAVAIMGAYLIMFFSPMLVERDRIYALLSNKIWQWLLDGIYYLTPRTFEVGAMVKNTVLLEPIPSWAPIWHSLALGVLFFSSAVLLLKRKNF